MTQDEIIELARQSGMSGLFKGKLIDEFKAFDEFVAQKKEKILAVLRRKPDQQIFKVLDEIRRMK